MASVLEAFQAFFDHLRAVAWEPVLLALVCQAGRMCARSRAWRNVLAAAYPGSGLRWRTVFGAYAAGAAVEERVLPLTERQGEPAGDCQDQVEDREDVCADDACV